MTRRLVLLLLLLVCSSSAVAEEWSRARISKLPDSAFAVVETAPHGKKVRHLPHHDEGGDVDRAHLKAALSRLSQVKWQKPASEAAARRHLEEHVKEQSATKSDSSTRGMIRLR